MASRVRIPVTQPEAVEPSLAVAQQLGVAPSLGVAPRLGAAEKPTQLCYFCAYGPWVPARDTSWVCHYCYNHGQVGQYELRLAGPQGGERPLAPPREAWRLYGFS
jgi:hypothetical protein